MTTDDSATDDGSLCLCLSDGDIDSSTVVTGNEIGLRNYQVELTTKAIQGQNVLIFAPTGTGKTVVAKKIIEDHLRGKPDAKVAFLVPVVTLVDQQLKLFNRSWDHKVIGLSGANKSLNSPLSWNIPFASVFIVTSDILKNALEESNENKLQSISTFSLIVFDECHHCDKKHSYNRIMFHYFQEKKAGRTVPQIIGLTASTGTNQAKSIDEALSQLFALCGNLDICHISTVEDFKTELESIQSKPTEEIVRTLSRPEEHFEDALQHEMGYCEKLLHEMDERGCFPDCPETRALLQLPSDRLHPKYLQLVVRLPGELLNSCHDNEDHMAGMAIHRFLRVCYDALMVNHLFRSADAINLIAGELRLLPCGAHLSETEIIIRSRMQSLIRDPERYDLPENPCVEVLVDRIKCQIESDGQSRVIVFVRERIYAEILRKIFLARLGSAVKSDIILGSEGLTKCEAQDILHRFKRGDIKVLFATSVVEEGADVLDCNMVIKYGHVTNETARVQCRGRARAADSKYLVIVPPRLQWQVDKENINTKRESLMHSAIEKFQRMDLDSVREKIGLTQKQRELLDSPQSLTTPCTVGDPPSVDTVAWHLHCKNCKLFICTSNDLRVANSAHYLLVNEERFSSMSVSPGGNQNNAAILCSQCQHQLASRQSYRTILLPNGKVDKFAFTNEEDSSFSFFKTWKKVPFPVASCEIDDLTKIHKEHSLSN